MERDTGPCTDYKPYWYFEPVSRACRRFLYGGCEGNGNRFNSFEECRSSCLDRDVAVTKPFPTTTVATTTTEAIFDELPPDDTDGEWRTSDDSLKETEGNNGCVSTSGKKVTHRVLWAR